MLNDLHNEALESINDIFPESTYAEERLWRFVIFQAVIDACMDQTTAKNKEWLKNSQRLSRDAKNWIDNGRDFLKVCELANLPPHLTRYKLLDFLTNPRSQTLSELRKQVDHYEKEKVKQIARHHWDD